MINCTIIKFLDSPNKNMVEAHSKITRLFNNVLKLHLFPLLGEQYLGNSLKIV